jgi:PKD repeat protein
MRLLALTAALAGALAAPSIASGTAYCVNEPACVSAGGVKEEPNANGIQTGLTAAEGHKNVGGPDQVLIGAGSYTREEGFSYIGEAVVIRGAGVGSTTLSRGGPEGRDVFALAAVSASEPSLSGVKIVVPAIKDMTGLGLASGLVEGVKIESPVGASVAGGLAIEGSGVFSHGAIDVLNGTGVEQRGGEVLYTTIFGAGFGVQASTRATLKGDTISGGSPLVSYFSKPLVIEDSLIDMGGASNVGAEIVANTNGSTLAFLRHIAIVHGGQTGLVVAGQEANATVVLENSIASEVQTPISVYAEGSGTTASLSADYSSFDMLTSRKKAGAGATSSLVAEHLLSTMPAFVSPLTGDFRLAPGSPLIDAGTPGELGLGELATDLGGNPRIVHGRRDVGPYEYQWRGPVISAATASTSAPLVGQSVTFSGSATAPEAGDEIAAYQWSFDEGVAAPPGAAVTHSFATPGPHTATLTVTDSIGLTASATVKLTASERVIMCAVRACGCGALAGQCPPPFRLLFSGLRLKPTSFRAARKGVSISRAPIGSRIDYSLNGSATVTFSVQRLLNGVRHGKSCLAPRRGLRGKSCKRTAAIRGSFSHTSSVGASSLRFSGRVNGHALAPGSYVLVGMAGAVRLSAPFTILR